MGFSYMNAETLATQLHDDAVTGENMNWFRVPAVVDVTGMEFAYGLGNTKAAGSASIFTITAVDGGSTGDAVATTAVLHATLSNGPSTATAWTVLVPRSVAGSASADLDADDYVNLVTTTAGTASTGLTAMVSYIYGKPANIA